MSHFRDKLRQNGYDAEEAYFHKREQELIKKTRDANAKAQVQLKLIKGGVETDRLKLPAARANKKAA